MSSSFLILMSTHSERVGVVDELLQIQDDCGLGQGQRRGTVNFGPASQSAESASTKRSTHKLAFQT